MTKDNRKIYETKSFWGALVFAGAVIAESLLGVDLGMLKTLALTWTGLSVAERMRK